jgi:electron transfer flavoprotein alpha subunit
VVSGGHAPKKAETFKGMLNPLADALGAAVGASRAAVDAGYATHYRLATRVMCQWLLLRSILRWCNPHLVGMKDSKLFMAMNKVNTFY